MIDTLYTAIIGHVIEIFFIAATIAVLYGVRYIKGKLTTEQQILIDQITRSVVLYVQQQFPKEEPRAKLGIAVEHAVDLLQQNGIKVDDNVIHVMIESNLKELKREFGNEWNDKPPD